MLKNIQNDAPAEPGNSHGHEHTHGHQCGCGHDHGAARGAFPLGTLLLFLVLAGLGVFTWMLMGR